MPSRRPHPLLLLLLVLTLVLAFFWWRAGRRLQLDSIDLPQGFTIHLYSDSVPGARSLAIGDKGTVFVGSRDEGVVYALVDDDRDGVANRRFIVARGLHSPNGVAFKDGSLFIAEIPRISRLDSIEARLAAPPAPIVIFDRLPRDGHHGWKFIRFGPDGRLYIPVGAPCNICLPEDSVYASIWSITPDGGDFRLEAAGVRNTVGFDWHPVTGDLWFTDNGRDWMGENEPPDELNRRTRQDEHFGFPFCHGRSIQDPDFHQRSCDQLTPATVELGPHVAALGMRFYTGSMFPAEYRNQVFIAEHGSWNRLLANGYRLTVVKQQGGRFEYDVFASGWERLNRAWGRPVDVLVMPDGALLVSDDRAGAVYRISHRNP